MREGVPEFGDTESQDAWVERTRVVLSPIAAPSIRGLFGFASATFMVAANEAWASAAGTPGSTWRRSPRRSAAAGALTQPTGQFPELGYWFLTLSAITFAGAFAAWLQNLGIFAVLLTSPSARA